MSEEFKPESIRILSQEVSSLFEENKSELNENQKKLIIENSYNLIQYFSQKFHKQRFKNNGVTSKLKELAEIYNQDIFNKKIIRSEKKELFIEIAFDLYRLLNSSDQIT